MRTTTIWSDEAVKVAGAVVDPAALLALVFGLWRLGVDVGWTGDFVIEKGLFSHWQVWIALAIGIKSSGALLQPSKPGKQLLASPEPAKQAVDGTPSRTI